MTRKPKDICLWTLRATCIGIATSLLTACIQTTIVQPTVTSINKVMPTQTINGPTLTPTPAGATPTSTPCTFIVTRDRSHLSEALFVVLSDDQTQLLAAHEGETDLQVLYQFPPPLRAQVTFYPADFPIISHDGIWVTVVENEELITRIDRIPLVGPDEPMTILSWCGCQSEAAISPDGTRVAFLAAESECTKHGEDYSPKHVYVMDSDGNNVKRLTPDAADRCFLNWSPSSSQITYREVCDPAASSPPQVYVVTLESYNNPSQATQVTASGTIGPYAESTWSPDGEWLQWAAYRNGVFGGYRLSRLDAEGRVIEEIISGLGEDVLDGGVWSHSSAQLVGITRDNVLAIWDIETGELTTVQLQGVRPFQPQRWLPDDRRLIFAGQRVDTQGNLLERQWFTVNTDGTNLVEFKCP